MNGSNSTDIAISVKLFVQGDSIGLTITLFSGPL